MPISPDTRISDLSRLPGRLIDERFGRESQGVKEALLRAVKQGFPEKEVCQLMEVSGNVAAVTNSVKEFLDREKRLSEMAGSLRKEASSLREKRQVWEGFSKGISREGFDAEAMGGLVGAETKLRIKAGRMETDICVWKAEYLSGQIGSCEIMNKLDEEKPERKMSSELKERLRSLRNKFLLEEGKLLSDKEFTVLCQIFQDWPGEFEDLEGFISQLTGKVKIKTKGQIDPYLDFLESQAKILEAIRGCFPEGQVQGLLKEQIEKMRFYFSERLHIVTGHPQILETACKLVFTKGLTPDLVIGLLEKTMKEEFPRDWDMKFKREIGN